MAPEIIEGKSYTCVVDWWSFGILIFEMLYSRSPFRGKDMKETFEHIRKSHIEFPHHPQEDQIISQKVKDLIKELLHHKSKKRLGFSGGSSEIKDHPFFRDVKFQLLIHQTPPIVPTLSSNEDSHYFKDIKNDWSLGDNDETLDPRTLPDDSIWKSFNINRGSLDPDDIHQFTNT
jgi:hypothetical protein